MYLVWQFTLMDIPTIDKYHLVLNISEHLLLLLIRLTYHSLRYITVISDMIINLMNIVNCHTGYLLQHSYA